MRPKGPSTDEPKNEEPHHGDRISERSNNDRQQDKKPHPRNPRRTRRDPGLALRILWGRGSVASAASLFISLLCFTIVWALFRTESKPVCEPKPEPSVVTLAIGNSESKRITISVTVPKCPSPSGVGE